MNREIKFRARWKDTNKVIEDFMEDSFTDALNDDCLVVEQFTGLKDKNGVEIYEGDIYEVAGNIKYQVKFLDGQSNFEWYGGAFGLWLNEETFFPFDEYAVGNGKIIGNIHDNPTLLQ